MPAIYPKKMSNRNAKLLPFAVRDLYGFITFMGQEAPKLTIIITSNISAITVAPNLSIYRTCYLRLICVIFLLKPFPERQRS